MKKAKYFSAKWCGPCKTFKPVVSNLIDEGYDIEMIDVDENQSEASKYQVMSIPMVVFEEDGKVVDAVLGVTSRDDLIDRLK